ncbi:MAG TPA: transglycosylase domain-containing protein [Actinomycetota bacterium]|nr:transglycosylase domain-containing protein [Actinomycetota bacterium]
MRRRSISGRDIATGLRRLLLLLMVIATAGGLVALELLPVLAGPGMVVHQLDASVLAEAGTPLHIPSLPERSVIHAADGSVLATLYLDQNRDIVPLSGISNVTRKAVLAVEDHRFYQHGPVDLQAILRALISNLRAGRVVEGGSTIAQQLAKNTETGSAETLARKIAEAKDAIRIERTYSKDQILEMYLNQVYLGNSVYGIGTAARFYFAEPASRLSLPQAALLGGMIAAPEYYNPLHHKARAVARRNEVLARMRDLGWIPRGEYFQAAATPVTLSRRTRTANLPGPEPYFVRYVEEQFLQDRRFGRTYADRLRALFQGGLQIYTTLKPKLQSAARAAIRSHLPLRTDPRAAVVTIDPRTGAVLAMVGGTNFRKSKFNLASQAHRSAGSAFKVFTLTAALEEGIPPSRAFSSASPITIPDCGGTGVPWHVGNAEPGTGGAMSLWEATKFSVNVVFAQLVNEVGPKKVVEVAHRMGIASPLAAYCPITLGASGVSPLEMTSAYATVADAGVHCRPYPIAKVISSTGETIFRARPHCARAIPSPVAAQITAMLEGVVHGGTGTRADIGRPQAGKTGTAQDYQDAWFMGFIPQLCTGVWVGYPRAEIPMRDVHGLKGFGGLLAAPIWHDYMTRATKSLRVMGFPTPPRPPQGSARYRP